MYICICNAISDKDIKDAIDNGANTPGKVYKFCRCSVQCGRCVETVCKLVKNCKNNGTCKLYQTSDYDQENLKEALV